MTLDNRTINEICVDDIVRRVLARLDPTETGQLASSRTNDAEHFVADRVVSMAQLAGHPADIQTLAVREDAIVTPAVVDYLRDHQVVLRRVNATIEKDSFATLTIGSTHLLPPSVQAAVRAEGVLMEVSKAPTLRQLLETLIPQLAASRQAIAVWTAETHLAICLANRHPDVRAVTAGSADDVRAAAAEIGANLFLVSATTVSAEQASEIFAAVATIGSVECPPQIQPLLASVQR